MSKVNDINKITNEIERAALKKLTDKIEECRPEFQKKLGKKLEERVQSIFNEVVDEFYGDYNPRFYNRSEHEGMKCLLKTKVTNSTFSYWFDETQLAYRNGYSGEDGLYTTVFRKGWHGGANIDGNMLVPYRTDRSRNPIEYNGNGVNEWSNAKWQSPYEKYRSRWQEARQAPHLTHLAVSIS